MGASLTCSSIATCGLPNHYGCRCVCAQHTRSRAHSHMHTHLHTHTLAHTPLPATHVYRHIYSHVTPPPPPGPHTFIYVAPHLPCAPARTHMLRHKYACTHKHTHMSAGTCAHTYTVYMCARLKRVQRDTCTRTQHAPRLANEQKILLLGCVSSRMGTVRLFEMLRLSLCSLLACVSCLWFLCCTLSALDIRSVQRFKPLLLGPVLG